jgi:rSAM/selenodomain-associated transferase 2
LGNKGSQLTGGVSVIIPALDEEEALCDLLSDLAAQKGVDIQIIVADGGSLDRTREVFETSEVNDRIWVEAPRGRGAQMNEGARAARFSDLVFLHADARLDDENLLARGLAAMERECAISGRALGHFASGFHDSPPDFTHFFLAAKTTLNLPECVNGDQGFWIKKRFFEELGGFEEALPFLEDLRLAERVFSEGKIFLLPGKVETSSRRFRAEGVKQRLLLNALIRFAHYSGLEGFYSRAGALYREKCEAGPLRIAPFFFLLWAEGRKSGACRFINNLCKFGADNGWQVNFWLDCRRAFKRGDAAGNPLRHRDAGVILRALSGAFVIFFFFAVLATGGLLEPGNR